MVVANAGDIMGWNIACVILFVFLFIIWSKDEFINVVLKMIFLGMAIWGLLILFGK